MRIRNEYGDVWLEVEKITGYPLFATLPMADWVASVTKELTHSGRDKMADIFQTTFSNVFLLNENVWISTKISL